MTTNLAVGIFLALAMMVWSTVCYAWVDERQQRAARRDLVARAAIRRRHDRELAEIRYYLQAADKVIRPIIEPAPSTQPIVMPAPAGPATVPADQVLIAHWAEDVPHPVDSDERKAQHEAWVTETLARYEYTGRNR